MRAKPDMKPWVNTANTTKSPDEGRHSCKAQGGMRAKPDMKPWGYTDNPTKSPERAAPLQSPGWNEGKARYETLGKQKSVQRALKGRHSCIAQGEMRAKPDMKPWGYSKQYDKEP